MKVLVISLPGCRTRRESAGRQLADRSIAFEFLDGVDGRSPGHPRLEATTRSIAVPEQQFGAFRLVKYVKAPQGALAYGIAPAAARSLLRHSSTFAAPVDVFVRNFFRHKVPLFGLYPYTVANGELSGDSVIGRRVKPAQRAPVAVLRFLKKGFRLAMNGKENLLYAAGLRQPCCSD